MVASHCRPNDEEFGREFPSINSTYWWIDPSAQRVGSLNFIEHTWPPLQRTNPPIPWKLWLVKKRVSVIEVEVHHVFTVQKPHERGSNCFFFLEPVGGGKLRKIAVLAAFLGPIPPENWCWEDDDFLCHFRCYVRFRHCTWESFSNWGFLEQAPKTDLNNHRNVRDSQVFLGFRFWKNPMGTARLKAHHVPPNCCFSMQFSPEKLISDLIFRCYWTAWENPWKNPCK